MGKVYLHEKKITTRRRTVRVKVMTKQTPPRKALIRLVTENESFDVVGTLVTAYTKNDGFIAYYDLLARYRDMVEQHLHKIQDAILLGEATGETADETVQTR